MILIKSIVEFFRNDKYNLRLLMYKVADVFFFL